MRITSRILIVFIFIFLAARANSAEVLSLSESRGFIKGKCYDSIASFQCKDYKTCFAMLFPKTQAQLTFRVKGLTGKILDQDLYKISFQVDPKSPQHIKLISKSIAPESNLKKLTEKDILGQPKSCTF